MFLLFHIVLFQSNTNGGKIFGEPYPWGAFRIDYNGNPRENKNGGVSGPALDLSDPRSRFLMLEDL